MRSVWLKANPGAIGSRCVAQLLQGTYARCGGVSTGLTHILVAPDEWLTVGLKSWSRGQKSQDASTACSGGVSAVIGSSDLNAHTLVSERASGNQPSCLLPSGQRSIRVGMAWQLIAKQIVFPIWCPTPDHPLPLVRTAQHRRKFQYQTLVDPCFRPNSSGLFLTQFSFLR